MAAKVIGWVSAAVLGIGLLVGLMPVSTSGANCGSAFVASSDAFGAEYAQALRGIQPDDISGACDGLRSIVRIPAVALIVLGAVGALAAASIAFRTPTTKPDQASSR